MKRVIMVVLCAMLVFTGCKKEEPVINETLKTEETVINEEEKKEDVQQEDMEDLQEVIEEPEEEEYVPEEQTEEQKTPPVQPEITIDGVGYNDSKSWWFSRNSENIPPTAQQEINIAQYDAYYIGDTSEKIIYLTFDEGYEAGYTGQILDVLKENDVKAMFFVTGHYLNSQPELVKRMAEEGHLVGNHSYDHLDHTAISDDEMVEDIESCQQLITETIGYEMPKFFRPPSGVYSIRTLEKAQEMGYKTIFWSFAYKDWDVNSQKGAEYAFEQVTPYLHNGAILLLHAVSKDNAESLGDIIDYAKEQGYRFASLDELKEY